jgi:hypothetical protein
MCELIVFFLFGRWLGWVGGLGFVGEGYDGRVVGEVYLSEWSTWRVAFREVLSS